VAKKQDLKFTSEGIMNFIDNYMNEVKDIVDAIDNEKIKAAISVLRTTREITEGRVFVLGVGGSAGNASHMVNDLRKLCDIEAYCPTDNVPELTARTNDEGFDTVFEEYLKVSKFNFRDTIFILSVGGGDENRNVSVGLIKAIKYAHSKEGSVISIVGKPDGYAAQNSDVAIIIPCPAERVTPHSEAFQAVVWHCIVSHPDLQIYKTKW
jgi:D-sedoheptulose 7-phosphate isomerase